MRRLRTHDDDNAFRRRYTKEKSLLFAFGALGRTTYLRDRAIRLGSSVCEGIMSGLGGIQHQLQMGRYYNQAVD